MKSLKLTLKAWPVIAAATIGLCYLTQAVAKLFGVELPDQANIDLVRRCAGWNWNFVLLCAQVLVLMPAIEELIFRFLLFRMPLRLFGECEDLDIDSVAQENRTAYIIASMVGVAATAWSTAFLAIISSALFSAAHYIAQPFPDAAFLALFFFGLAQCWLYSKTSHLWCAMLNHALFNLTNLVLLFVLPA